ncbi:MAG: Asp-tRNA(Asn)/Glu-tRNA(Gln) amidotransferase subunit GatC [Sphingomonadales bacterium]|nr:Asp-tRNA(Asn)/Glu-tRNA(Gln) amidotransferase subunit GatC [Sphingomonadales bacterium]
MSVDTATVSKIARLARLKVEDDKLDHLAGELSAILDWVEALAEVDTDGVPPMTSAVETRLHLRADEVSDGDKAEDVLKNAPDAQYGFYAVPKVIE